MTANTSDSVQNVLVLGGSYGGMCDIKTYGQVCMQQLYSHKSSHLVIGSFSLSGIPISTVCLFANW